MTNLLSVLFALLLGLGVICFFPVRNSVAYRGRPWATWGLIAAHAAMWLTPILDGLFGGQWHLAAAFDQLVFTGDYARTWTLVTCQFVHTANPFQLFVLLWLLYLIGPVLEERLKAHGLLALYVGGAASVAALYGALAMNAGARIYLAGMSPGLGVLLGLYLVLYPFEDILFFYNVLFFTFCGTVGVAPFFLVLFVVLAHIVSGLAVALTAMGFGPGALAKVAWLEDAVPLLGLGVGFALGVLQYGLGAFVGKTPVSEKRSPADRMVGRALARLMAEPTPGSPSKSAPLSRRERSQSRLALADDAPPEELEAFAEQCLRNKRDLLLEAAYARFRGRFPERCFGPGLQAELARRFEQTNRPDLTADAYRLLLKCYPDAPVAADARLRFGRLLAQDPTAVEEAIELLEGFLGHNPPREAADEAHRLLDLLIETSGRGRTYEGLGPHRPFHFSQPIGHSRPLATPAGAPSRPEGLPIGRSAEEIFGGPEPDASSTPSAQTPLLAGEIVPDSSGDTLTSWGFRPAVESEVAAAMAAARSYAVILLPSASLIMDKALAVLGEFWMVRPDEAAEQLRRCRGILLDDAPSGRAVVLARKMRGLGLPVTVVPIVPEIAYATCEDVFELAWNDLTCSNVSSKERRSFGWEQVRLANVARVGLPGAGAAYRLVLELFVAQPHCFLRYWENTVNFARSGLGGKPPAAADPLQSLVEYLDRRAPRALKTPSFGAMAKKTGPPLDFHSPAELDHYDRWFLYAGFGKYSANA